MANVMKSFRIFNPSLSGSPCDNWFSHNYKNNNSNNNDNNKNDNIS